MRILLADDHAIVRSGLRRILADAFPDVEIGEVGTYNEIREKVRESDWSLLILDIALEDRNSLDLIPELKALRPTTPIIVLSMYGEMPFVVRALRAGVSAYLTKDRAPEELIQAIHSVLQGRRYLSEEIAGQLADHVATQGSTSGKPHEQLSAREYEVLLQLASGHSVTDIATSLGLSVKTISTYRARILEKMGLESNLQLIRYAMQHGLVK
jgi:DNA-binding NarL/FixJ family response regulator